MGAGPVGFGGAGCPCGRSAAAAAAAGFPVADAAGFGLAVGSVPAAAFGGVETSEGGEGLAGVVVVSDSTEREGVDFTPPGGAGLSAAGF